MNWQQAPDSERKQPQIGSALPISAWPEHGIDPAFVEHCTANVNHCQITATTQCRPIAEMSCSKPTTPMFAHACQQHACMSKTAPMLVRI